MKKIISLLPFVLVLLWQSSALAATQAQLDAISPMGKLNGIALQCRYVEQMQRIKMSLVLHLPKQRELGDWFEQTTNSSFLDFMNKDLSCPDINLFEQQIDAAIKQVATTFKQ